METEMRFSHVIESLDPSLGEGWARATLLIGESPFWYGETRANFEWTWIDFLEWLSCSWAALWLEEGWPINLPMALHPGQLLDLAREVWVDLPDEEAAWQERELLAYLDRHDLSRGMPGAFLPSILLARSGNTIWVDPEEGEATRCDFRTLIDSLEAVGDALAAYFKDSDNDRVKSVLDHWRNRHEAIRRDYLRYKSGMTKQRLEKLSAWFTETGRQMMPEETEQEPVYLAAARMTRHLLPIDRILELLELLGRVAEKETKGCQTQRDQFPRLSPVEGLRPWEQGYALADELRSLESVDPADGFDPEQYLSDRGVRIETHDFGTPDLDAIACWGNIKPVIVLNTYPGARPSGDAGRRSTLAHELCHFLVDQDAGLPVAEVLGGEVDPEVEKRANAFAAELLLPQSWAKEAFEEIGNIEPCMVELGKSHGVSKTLAAWQIRNCKGIRLDEDNRILLASIIDGTGVRMDDFEALGN